MKRGWVGFLCLGLAGSAFASFEMQLVLEREGGLGQVRRYDPENNLNLGTFGRGTMAGGIAIALNQSIQTAYVLDRIGASTVVHRYNYNTGSFQGSFVADGVSLAREIEVAPSGELMIAGVRNGTSSVHTFSVSGSYLSSVSFYVGNVATDMVRLADGRTLAAGYRNINGNLEMYLTGYSAAGAAIGFTPLGNLPATQEAFANAKIASLGNRLVLNAGFFNGNSGAASYTAFVTLDSNPFTTVSVFSPFDPILANPTATWMSDFSVGHDGQAWGVARQGSQAGTLRGIRYNSSILSYQYNEPNYDVNNFVDVAMVVAPEPVSLFALGVGVLALVRRRRPSRL